MAADLLRVTKLGSVSLLLLARLFLCFPFVQSSRTDFKGPSGQMPGFQEDPGRGGHGEAEESGAPGERLEEPPTGRRTRSGSTAGRRGRFARP